MLPSASPAPLVRVERLSKTFRARGGIVRAVSDVSFDVYRGEVLGWLAREGVHA